MQKPQFRGFYKEEINESRTQRYSEPLIDQRLNQYYSELAPVLAPLRLSENNCAIRSLVRLAKTLGYCDYDLHEIKFEQIQTYRDTTGVSLEQFKEILKVPNRETLKGKRDFAILLLLFETAMRRGELSNICLGDYQPESKVVWILGKGKGTQKESMTISSQIVEVINDYLKVRRKGKELTAADPLFATTDKKNIWFFNEW